MKTYRARKRWTIQDFERATGLLPRVVAQTVLTERGEFPANHKWFVCHVEVRVVKLLNGTNPHLEHCRRKLVSRNGNTSRDFLYAFIGHWVTAYLSDPVTYRERSAS